jgi:phosphatidylinositol alpha 1,6-mannosyltransferase
MAAGAGEDDAGVLVIVHVTDCFHPRLGGIEIQVGDLARAQQECGQAAQVITATPAGGRQCDYGYPVHRVVAPLPWELPVHPRAGAHLDRLFRRLRPDVVHVHIGSVSPFAWSAVSSAMRCGLPTVATVHSMWGPASRAMYRVLDRLTGWSGAPLVVTAVSTQGANLIMKARPRVTATAVPNGISAQEWRCPPELMPSRADDAVHIVAIGRLAPRKQPITLLKLLRAARLRIATQVPVRVTVAGAGPALPLMRTYLRQHSMTEWVWLSGRLDRDGVRALLGTADLFVNPTVRESFGIATLEARTAGVPVIARAGNGVSEFIRHNEEGLLCDNGDELVEAIVQLVEDTETRRRIGAHNRGTEPTNCTWPVVTEAFARCYDRAVALAAPPRQRPLPNQPG